MATNGTPPVDPNPDVQDVGEPFSHYLQLLRGSVRPLVTLGLVAVLGWAFTYAVAKDILSDDTLTNVVVAVISMATTVVGVWFGQRR